MKISEFDFIFLSYDEPNADLHYADLCNKVPWAKRVHGVKGSDAAHKSAAELSETDWFVSVDADNIVDLDFLDQEIEFNDDIKVFSWTGRNQLNGLRYGNGGLKLWNKQYVLDMKSHEAADTKNSEVDFCWESVYRQYPESYSKVVITGSPFQAWRAGFREGVKMTLVDGIKVEPYEIKNRVWWHNLHRLRIWSTVGTHDENGIYAVYGARLGTWLANCTDWNYVDVRDFEMLKGIYFQYGKPYEDVDSDGLVEEIKSLGEKIKLNLGLDWPWLDADQSSYTLGLYTETLKMAQTYYRVH
jgi:hypothetical protein